jgi:predicted nucleotidyltransferase
MQFIKQHTKQIEKLCQQHKVKRLYAFGSVLTNHFAAESDIDLIVAFNPMQTEQYADNYFNLKFALEDTLHRPIDLLEENAIRNPYFKQAIENQRQLIYGY